MVTITATPNPVAFGDIGMDTTSLVKKVTVKVSGGSYLPSAPTLSGANTDDFTITATNCSGTIASGKNCTVSMTFTPTQSDGTAESATLNLGGNAAAAVALTGTSSSLVTVTPTNLIFSMQVDNTSPSKKITVKNNTSASISLQNPSFSPGNGVFALAAGGTCGSSLGPFGYCDYLLDFTPISLGATTGSFIIQTGAFPTADPLQFIVSLSGTGTPQTAVSPTGINFGTVTTGTSSAAKSVKLTNYQPVAISVNPGISGPGFAIASGGTCTGSLAAKSSCTINLTFSPSVQGNATGTLTITDSPDIASPHSVALRGNGLMLQ